MREYQGNLTKFKRKYFRMKSASEEAPNNVVTLVLIIANLRASLLKKTQDAEVAFQNE